MSSYSLYVNSPSSEPPVSGRHDGRRLNENDISTLPYTSRLRIVGPKRLAVQAVPNKASFPRAMLLRLDVGLHVHERLSPDNSNIADVGTLAIERFVWKPVAQVDGHLH